MKIRLMFGAGLAIMAFASTVMAATLEVGAGKTYSTIPEAVTASVAGDTILVYGGTYTNKVWLTDAANPI